MKIAVIGTGYVGLVTGTCFAENGNEVICVDIDKTKIRQMQAGKMPIYEPELEGLFKRNIKEGRLTFTTNLEQGISDAQAIFLALPTPPGEDGSADLSYILGVAEELGSLLKNYTVVIDKSTVPVGTSEKVYAKITKNTKASFDVVSNPEFLREGVAVADFMNPDRVVIGTDSDKARKVMEELYEPFVRQGNPIEFMSLRSAEVTKYAANAFLATKISFMNEIARLCELVGADVDQVRLGIGQDQRIGKLFLYPGIGYGGSCFPKDVKALSRTGQEHGYTFQILEAVEAVNERQKHWVYQKIITFFGEDLSSKKFALWGLAFKPDTDDIREAPAIKIIKDLLEAGAEVMAFDPEAIQNTRNLFGDTDRLTFATDQYGVLDDADALIVATEWKEFQSPDFKMMKIRLKRPVIFDGRNIFSLEKMKDEGFRYESIGREVVDV